MTRRPADPEVLADLRLRDDSEGDRLRSSLVNCECGHHVRSHHGNTGPCSECDCEEFDRVGGPLWSPPAIVERWPCTGCNALVDMTADAIDLHAMFNRQLERRGERPLAKRIPCAECKRKDEELAAAQRRPHQQAELELGENNERPSGTRTAGKGT